MTKSVSSGHSAAAKPAPRKRPIRDDQMAKYPWFGRSKAQEQPQRDLTCSCGATAPTYNALKKHVQRGRKKQLDCRIPPKQTADAADNGDAKPPDRRKYFKHYRTLRKEELRRDVWKSKEYNWRMEERTVKSEASRYYGLLKSEFETQISDAEEKKKCHIHIDEDMLRQYELLKASLKRQLMQKALQEQAQ